MEFLSKSEAKKWVTSQGRVYSPYREGFRPDLQIGFEDKKDGGFLVGQALLELCESASQILAVVEDHPLTYDERRGELMRLRLAMGESQPMEKTPAMLFSGKDRPMIENVVRTCIGPGSWWSLYLYLAPQRTTVLVWESSMLDLWSDRAADQKRLQARMSGMGCD